MRLVILENGRLKGLMGPNIDWIDSTNYLGSE